MNQDNFIFIIRHGETIWNKAKLLQGRKNISLSPLGIKQAYEMASILKSFPIDFIGVSPLIRTLQTASIIGKELNLKTQTVDDLIARSYGDWEGKSIDEIREKNKELFKILVNEPLDEMFVKPPHHSMESYKTVSERALKPLKTTQNFKNPLFITHSGVITSILLALKFDCDEIPLLGHLGYIKLRRSKESLSIEHVEGRLETKVLAGSREQERLFIF